MQVKSNNMRFFFFYSKHDYICIFEFKYAEICKFIITWASLKRGFSAKLHKNWEI